MSEDILRAARHALHVWDTEEDPYERKSQALWEAMEELRHAVRVIHEVVPTQ